MDVRTPLVKGSILTFSQVDYKIESVIGYGSNAYAYTATYYDNISKGNTHHVILKELFPYHPKNLIYRTKDGSIMVEGEAGGFFDFQKKSFLKGNECHLRISAIRADMTSVNINSFEQNNTIYTVIGNSDGVTLLEKIIKNRFDGALRSIVSFMLSLLNALSVFHSNGLLHLDISPDNILLLPSDGHNDKNGKVYLIDYNSVWDLNDANQFGSPCFTAKENYSSPEIRLKEIDSISYSADLFSVCAVFLELLRGKPLDFSDVYIQKKLLDNKADIFAKAPVTVISKTMSIVKKGLKVVPDQRYQSIDEIRMDLIELQNRIEGRGISHAAIWEAGKKNLKNIRLDNNVDLLPCFIEDENGNISEIMDCINDFKNVQLIGSGGMGKTTAMLELLRSGLEVYNPKKPVPIYIPLYKYGQSDIPFIQHFILSQLKFDEKIVTVEDALHALNIFLDSNINGSPSVQLILDGLNEVSENKKQLIMEIANLSKKIGVQIILSSKLHEKKLDFKTIEIRPLTDDTVKKQLSSQGILYPAVKETQAMISNPMMLFIYIKTSIPANAGTNRNERIVPTSPNLRIY